MTTLLQKYCTEDEFARLLKEAKKQGVKEARPGKRERAEMREGERMRTGKRGSRLDAYDRMMRGNG